MVGGGVGAFIGDAHRRSINIDGKAELVAGCFSRDYDNTLKTGSALHVKPERLYRSYEEMGEKESSTTDKIDFVVVVTPNDSHFAVCKAFLEAGINVVCDKPLVHGIEQARELKQLAEKKNLLFGVTYTYGGNVTVKHARELIKSGEIGEVRMVMGEYAQGWLSSGDGGKQGAWRTDPAQSGISNVIGDIGTHVENTVAQMTGLKIKRLLAKMDRIVEGRKLDDNSAVLMEYDSGASGLYWVSQIAIGSDNGLKVRVFGSKGTIEWSLMNSEDLIVIGADGVRKLHCRGYGSIAPAAAKYSRLPAGHNEGYLEAMANIYSSYCDCIVKQLDGTLSKEDVDFPTVEDVLNGVIFIHKCVESSNKGNVWVECG
jgi:predicted dehydrogenase